MWDSEEIILFCVQLIRAYTKNWIIIRKEKKSSNRWNPFIHVIFRGVSSKSSVLLWSIYDCLFSWTLRPGVMEIGDLGEKIIQIPNMTVNSHSERFLTMNLLKKTHQNKSTCWKTILMGTFAFWTLLYWLAVEWLTCALGWVKRLVLWVVCPRLLNISVLI